MGREANPSYPVYWGTALHESLEPLSNPPKMALTASQQVTGVESRILATLAGGYHKLTLASATNYASVRQLL